MEFRAWKGFCLCALGGGYPPESRPAAAPFVPLIFTVKRPPEKSRGWFAVSRLEEVFEPEDLSVLLPRPGQTPDELSAFVAAHGAGVLNTAFGRAWEFLAAPKPRDGLRVTLTGLGDVGGTLLTALKLLGKPLEEIAIYDPNEALCRRYEAELNQVLGLRRPRVTICPPERLFDCDLFLFTAARSVPALNSGVQDVRMAQYAANRALISGYARQARAAGFCGLFCQISDPVDHLARAVFLESNRDETGHFDACGLLPEQVQGFGLGVMAARAAYQAEKMAVDFSNGRVFGPHGEGLTVANDPLRYDADLSARLTQQTLTTNLQLRALGFKPYIAPALSSAALSILALVAGEHHYGAVPVGGAYFGCRSAMTPLGLQVERETLHPELFARLQQVHRRLEDFSYD